MNTAVDFLSTLELEDMEKIRLRIQEDMQTSQIKVTSSSDVVEEEQPS